MVRLLRCSPETKVVGLHPLSFSSLWVISLVRLTCRDFEMGGKWLYSCRFRVVLFLRFFSKQNAKKLCSSSQDFTLSALLKRYSHTIVVTWLQLLIVPVLFYQKLGLHMVDNLSVVVHTFLKRMLTLLSVDEIFLPMYEKLLLILEACRLMWRWRNIV